MGAVTEGQDRHLPTLDTCGKIEREKRKKYSKHEYQKLKMKEIENSLWSHFFNIQNPNSRTIHKVH
jgi:hypothetical protein